MLRVWDLPWIVLLIFHQRKVTRENLFIALLFGLMCTNVMKMNRSSGILVGFCVCVCVSVRVTIKQLQLLRILLQFDKKYPYIAIH